MRIALLFAVLLLVSVPLAGAAAQTATNPTGRVRYVISNRILSEATEPKAQVAQMQAAQQKAAAELREKQQVLEKTRTELGQATDTTVRTKLLQQEQQQRAELERLTAQAQQEIQTLQRTLNTAFQAKLREILDEILKGQDVDLVLSGDVAVLWAAPGADLTSAVIERWNAKVAAAAPAK